MTKDHMFESEYEFDSDIGETWTTIPNDIMRAGKDVFSSMGEKMTYLVCLSYSFKIGKEARPSQKTLAHDAICTDRAIRNFLSRLEEKGFLQKVGYHEAQGTVIWRVVIPSDLKLKWLEEKVIRAKAELGINEPKVQVKPEPKPETQDPEPKEQIPFKEIMDYLNEKTGKTYKNVPGNQKLIRTLWKQGYSLQDFKTVIDNQVADWVPGKFFSNGKEAITYLRPGTLFGPKFDEYLNNTPQQPKPQQQMTYGHVKPLEETTHFHVVNGVRYDLNDPEQAAAAVEAERQAKRAENKRKRELIKR